MNEYGIKVTINNPSEVAIKFSGVHHQFVSLVIDMKFLEKHLGSHINDLDFNTTLLISIVDLKGDIVKINSNIRLITAMVLCNSKVDHLVYDCSSSIRVMGNSFIGMLVVERPKIDTISIGHSSTVKSLQCKHTSIGVIHCSGKIQRISFMIVGKLYIDNKTIECLIGYCSHFEHDSKEKIKRSYLNGKLLKIGGIVDTYRQLNKNVVEYLSAYVI